MTTQTTRKTAEIVGYFCDHSDEPYGARTHHDWEWDEVNGGHTFQHSPNTISAHTGVDRGYLKPEDAERRCPRALPVYAVDAPALLARVAELEAERHTTNEALDIDALERLRAAAKAERDVEIIAWLGKKAREYEVAVSDRYESKADVIRRLADKIARGAVRPNNVAVNQ